MIYLASRSPRRAELIKALDRPFKIVPSEFRESFRHAASPEDNGMRNAWGKARRAKLPSKAEGIVLGCDTFLYFQGKHVGKPRNLKHAREMLHALAGHSHWVYSGLCLIDIKSGIAHKSFERTRVTFNPVTDADIDELFRRYNPLDKSGSYSVQKGRGILVKSVEGSESNVIGLPMELLRRELSRIKSAVA